MRPLCRALLVLALLSLGVLTAVPAQAHSYADPALTTVLDQVTPVLPAGVRVEVVPSVVDELVLSNTTAAPLVVLAATGEPIVEVSRTGVLANLSSPSWYLTGNPEGGAPVPADVAKANGSGAPRLARVTTDPAWAEFDPRLHPSATVPDAVRRARRPATLRAWTIPLTYAGRSYTAQGHVAFTPVRGGLTVAVTSSPSGLSAAPLQGELPGVFLSATAREVEVQGTGGEPFLRFTAAGVQANTASASWLADQKARGKQVAPATGVHWVRVSAARTYSWLDPRLRFPMDAPSEQVQDRSSPTVVQHWEVPVRVDGAAAALAGTVTWVPRAVGVAAVTPAAVRTTTGHGTRWLVVAAGLTLAVLVAAITVRTRRRT